MKLPPRVTAVAFENKTKYSSRQGQQFTRNAKNGFKCLKLISEVELLQLLTQNLCGFDPGLEAGSR